jgi:hypothetical protein
VNGITTLMTTTLQATKPFIDPALNYRSPLSPLGAERVEGRAASGFDRFSRNSFLCSQNQPLTSFRIPEQSCHRFR